MESPQPLSAAPPSRPVIECSATALLLWLFRRPILMLIGLLLRLAVALIKPTLLILGLVKLSQVLRAAAASPLPTPTQSPSPEEPSEAIAQV